MWQPHLVVFTPINPQKLCRTSRGQIVMNSSHVFTLLLVAAILTPAITVKPQGGDFVKSSCKITPFPEVCVASLRSYAGRLEADKSESELVIDAVKVSFSNAQPMTPWAFTLYRRSPNLNKTERSALKACMDDFGDTSDQIKQSLAELKRLRPETFKFQMSNVQTWMSAALRNEDSCLDGFQVVRDGRVKKLVQERVHRVSQFISNALALANAFASTHQYSTLF